MTKTYTIADLCALPDDALDALAAELRGYTEVFKMGTHTFWQDASGKKITESYKWKPTTDRNQSGELLMWAQLQGAKFQQIVAADGVLEINISARAETIAFCAAMLAMAGRLKGE